MDSPWDGPDSRDPVGAGRTDGKAGLTVGASEIGAMKTVLITGCSSGIGRATATAFLNDDWTVYATARDTDDVAALADAGC